MSEVAEKIIKGNGMLQKLDAVISSYPKPLLITAIVIIQLLLLYGDFRTGPYVPFGVFYLWSLYLAAKYAGTRNAYVMAGGIALAKTYVQYLMLPASVQGWQICWKFVSSYSIYTTFCYLIISQLSAKKSAEKIAISAVNRASEAEHKLLSISEATQQRIGRELHDDLGQHLTGAAFMAQVLSKKLKAKGHEETEDAEKITVMLNQSIAKTRNLSQGLYPEEIKAQGLNYMMEKFAHNVEATYQINCKFFPHKNTQLDDQELATHLFRITQEAVNNALRHGRASSIVLRLSSTAALLTLEIMDNGCGFDTRQTQSQTGLGLRSMRYRADILGASITVAPGREKGTHVTIKMPLQTPA